MTERRCPTPPRIDRRCQVRSAALAPPSRVPPIMWSDPQRVTSNRDPVRRTPQIRCQATLNVVLQGRRQSSPAAHLPIRVVLQPARYTTLESAAAACDRLVPRRVQAWPSIVTTASTVNTNETGSAKADDSHFWPPRFRLSAIADRQPLRGGGVPRVAAKTSGTPIPIGANTAHTLSVRLPGRSNSARPDVCHHGARREVPGIRSRAGPPDGNTSATELWLVRHGESVGNVAASTAQADSADVIEVGLRDADVPLTATGQVSGVGTRAVPQPGRTS